MDFLRLPGSAVYFPSPFTGHSPPWQFHTSLLSSRPPLPTPQFHYPSSLPSISCARLFVQRKWKRFYLENIEMHHPHPHLRKEPSLRCWESCQQISSCNQLLPSPPYLARAQEYTPFQRTPKSSVCLWGMWLVVAERHWGRNPELSLGLVKASSCIHCSLNFSSVESCFLPLFHRCWSLINIQHSKVHLFHCQRTQSVTPLKAFRLPAPCLATNLLLS